MSQQRSKAPRTINISVLSGEKTDGSGRICIHLFVRDESGPFVEPHALSVSDGTDPNIPTGRILAGPVRGRLVCGKIPAPIKSVSSATTSDIVVTIRTDDPRATSCHKCIASDIYTSMMAKFKEG